LPCPATCQRYLRRRSRHHPRRPLRTMQEPSDINPVPPALSYQPPLKVSPRARSMRPRAPQNVRRPRKKPRRKSAPLPPIAIIVYFGLFQTGLYHERNSIVQHMQKSIVSRDYRAFLRLFRETRKNAKLTQRDVAERIGQTQSFISKCERGERRIDIVELRTFCKAFGISFTKFAQRFDTLLGG